MRTTSLGFAVSTVTHQTRSAPFDGSGETRSPDAVRCIAWTDAPRIVRAYFVTSHAVSCAAAPMSSGWV